MIIYLVGSDSDQLKYRKRYRHALFTFGSVSKKKLDEMIERKRSGHKKKIRITRRLK